MKKSVKYVILLLCFVLVMAACVMLYDKLSAANTPLDTSVSAGTEEAPAQESDTDVEEKREPAPDFSCLSTNGNTVKLSDKLGKPIVLNFWASWCGPCTGELPAFENLYQEYGEDIEFMMVNMTDGGQETQNSAMRFLVNSDYTFPVYLDVDLEAAAAYGVYFIPQTHLINAEGELMMSHMEAVSEEKLRESIETYLLGD